MMRVREVATVNGYAIWSYYDHRWGGTKFFVGGKDGEYLTQRAAEDAARALEGTHA